MSIANQHAFAKKLHCFLGRPVTQISVTHHNSESTPSKTTSIFNIDIDLASPRDGSMPNFAKYKIELENYIYMFEGIVVETPEDSDVLRLWSDYKHRFFPFMRDLADPGARGFSILRRGEKRWLLAPELGVIASLPSRDTVFIEGPFGFGFDAKLLIGLTDNEWVDLEEPELSALYKATSIAERYGHLTILLYMPLSPDSPGSVLVEAERLRSQLKSFFANYEISLLTLVDSQFKFVTALTQLPPSYTSCVALRFRKSVEVD